MPLQQDTTRILPDEEIVEEGGHDYDLSMDTLINYAQSTPDMIISNIYN